MNMKIIQMNRQHCRLNECRYIDWVDQYRIASETKTKIQTSLLIVIRGAFYSARVQVLISCGPMDGCHGGDAGVANKWMADHGITVWALLFIFITLIIIIIIIINTPMLENHSWIFQTVSWLLITWSLFSIELDEVLKTDSEDGKNVHPGRNLRHLCGSWPRQWNALF